MLCSYFGTVHRYVDFLLELYSTTEEHFLSREETAKTYHKIGEYCKSIHSLLQYSPLKTVLFPGKWG